MNVLVLGASGGVGQHLVRVAVERGHTVTAVARSTLSLPPGARLLPGDVGHPGFLEAAMPGHDAVLSALGIRRQNHANPFSPLASPSDFTSATAAQIVHAMRRSGVRRVIAVSAAGVGDSRPGLNLFMRLMIRWTNVGANYRDLEEMERVYAQSGLDWCCVRPTGLRDGAPAGNVKVIPDFPFNAWIHRADVATWMVEHLGADLSANRTPSITEVLP